MKRWIKIICLLFFVVNTQEIQSEDAPTYWSAPFDTTISGDIKSSKAMTLEDVIRLTALHNPTLQSFEWRIKVAKGRLQQAGVWTNPEFDAGLEEVGWDAPGFRESEITLSLSQEFELFGQRRTRKEFAQSELESIDWQTRVAAFDIYLDVKDRFFTLGHAQRQVELATQAVGLTDSIAIAINRRVEQGASLQSELLLANLEYEKAQLKFMQAEIDQKSAAIKLMSLFKSDYGEFTVVDSEFDSFMDIDTARLFAAMDSSRNVTSVLFELQSTRAALNLTKAEIKPSITLSGGYKRLESNGSNSFVFGFSLPLPFFNRNQGEVASIYAQLRNLDYQKEQTILNTQADIQTLLSMLGNLSQQYRQLEEQLIPEANKAYLSLRQSYEAGRISYSTMLDGERSLIELQFELNDTKLKIRQSRISLERLIGMNLE